jgi:hypothetical protein
MTIEFRVTQSGLECAHELNGETSERVSFTAKLKFKPTGIRVEGTRMYDLTIGNAHIGHEEVVGTAVTLSIVKCLKEFIDSIIVGKVLNPSDALQYTVTNTGKHRLAFTILIDGNWIP